MHLAAGTNTGHLRSIKAVQQLRNACARVEGHLLHSGNTAAVQQTLVGGEPVPEPDQVSEQGRHEELLARGGLYARLYHKQFRSQAAEVPAAS